MKYETKGWIRFWRKRRDQLRARGGLNLAPAGHVALQEIRCRNRIAEVIGRPAAKEIELRVCLQKDVYDPVFVLPAGTPWSLWQQLQVIPNLLFPFGTSPQP